MFLSKSFGPTFKSTLVAFALFAGTSSHATEPSTDDNPYFPAHRAVIGSGYCDLQTVVNIRVVCKTWRTIADEQNIRQNPYFITSGFLNNALQENHLEINRLYAEISIIGRMQEMQFMQRIQLHMNVLSKTLDTRPLNNIQMLNLMAFQTTILSDPLELEAMAERTTQTFKAVRERFKAMPVESLQAQYFSKMALIFRAEEDLDYANMLLMRLNPPSAINLLQQFKQTDLSPNKDQSAIIVPKVLENQQLRRQNYTFTSERSENSGSAASGFYEIFRAVTNIFF